MHHASVTLFTLFIVFVTVESNSVIVIRLVLYTKETMELQMQFNVLFYFRILQYSS